MVGDWLNGDICLFSHGSMVHNFLEPLPHIPQNVKTSKYNLSKQNHVLDQRPTIVVLEKLKNKQKNWANFRGFGEARSSWLNQPELSGVSEILKIL